MATRHDHNTPNRASLAGHVGLESALQVHIRKLHEAKTQSGVDAMPVRGKDPWLGLMS